MNKNAAKQSSEIRKWILPIALVVFASIWSWYVVEHPIDKMVAAFMTWERLFSSLWEHIYLILIAASLAILISVPLGIILTRKAFAKFCGIVTAIINILQSIPSLAVIALMYAFTGIGAKTAIIAILIYSLLPILNNTIAGMRSVDPFVIMCAEGMGLTKAEILFKVELPLAFPIIFAGIRTAVVVSVGTAVIGTFIGAGGLGDIIVAGKNTSRYSIMLLAAGLSSIFALLLDSILGIVEDGLKERF